MKQEEMEYDNKETGCCALLNPVEWNEKRVVFDNRLFMKKRVKALFHIPINFGSVMKEVGEKMDAAEAYPKTWLMLSDENSLWGSDVYIATDREVPDAEMVKISGEFVTKVFEGSFKNVKDWIAQTHEFVTSKGKTVKKLYFYYTVCPKCAKQFGKNYVVVFAQVD